MSATQHLVTLRDTIVTAFEQHLAPLKVTVYWHDGPFGEDELENYSVKAPCVVLAIEGGKSKPMGGSIREEQQWRAFVITKRKPELTKGAANLFIYEHTLRLLHNSTWGEKNPSDVQGNNLYSSEVDMSGLSLWKIGWMQVVSIPPELSYDSLDNFLRLYVENTEARPTEEPAEPQVHTQHINLEGPT
jgi:hypothetical protein